jgi:hypothetical protein
VLATFAVAALVVAGLTACSSKPAQTPSTSPSAVVTSTQEPTPSPTPSPTPTLTVKPAAIVLSETGIGDVAMGTVDPIPALVKLLGPPNGTGIPQADVCGPGDTAGLMWPALTVSLDTSANAAGTLWGWELRGPAAPAGVTTKSGVLPGAPLSAAMALPGAAAPIYWDVMDSLIMEADGVTYWGDGSDPAKSMIAIVGVNIITCD